MVDFIKISIALCTCNGARFLDEQLASLASQTFRPAELVVCDDASDDGTWQILEDFQRNVPFPVRLYRNINRIGVGQNFQQAIQYCSGNVIALCDQDDVWQPGKLMIYARCIENGADAVCCDAEVTNTKLMPLGYTLWERVAFSVAQRQMAREGHLLQVVLKHYVIAGATLAFRTELRSRVLPIPSNWLYDAWLAAALASNGTYCIVDQCLQQYRQHENNAIGGQRKSIFGQLRNALATSRADYLKLEISRWNQLKEQLGGDETSSYPLRQVYEKLEHLRRRTQFPSNRFLRIPHVFSEITQKGYSRYSRNWGSAALDLFSK